MAKDRHKVKRIPIGAQLYPGKDNDLIEWLNGLPPGSRQQTIKDALRYALGLPQPHVETNGELDPAALDNLRTELYQQWTQWTQQLIDSLPGYVQTEVSKALDTPRQPVAPPPIEAADQIDQQTANERKSRLKRANW